VEIEQVEVTQLLGVTLNFKMSWSKHIDTTVAKMGRTPSIIKHCSAFLTTPSTRQVIQALVLSYLDYYSFLWSGAIKRDLKTGQHCWPLNVHRELTLIICM
jgi:hypothetical protein